MLLSVIFLGVLVLYFYLKNVTRTQTPAVPVEIQTGMDRDTSPDTVTAAKTVDSMEAAGSNAVIEKQVPKESIVTTSTVSKPKTATSPHKKTETAKTTVQSDSASALARLKIMSAPPFASIFVNGEPWGETPMTAFKTAPAGPVILKLKHRLFPAFDTTVTLTGGQDLEIQIQLKK